MRKNFLIPIMIIAVCAIAITNLREEQQTNSIADLNSILSTQVALAECDDCVYRENVKGCWCITVTYDPTTGLSGELKTGGVKTKCPPGTSSCTKSPCDCD